jgi:geranylgeranyl diphosphate synthase type 3
MFRSCKILHYSIDDIEDNSILRRGIPVAHSIYGVPSTISAANCQIYRALEMVLSLNHSKAATVFTKQALELHHGQAMEIYWRENCVCPSVEEYLENAKRSMIESDS